MPTNSSAHTYQKPKRNLIILEQLIHFIIGDCGGNSLEWREEAGYVMTTSINHNFSKK